MKRVVVDTNVYSAFKANVGPAVDALRRADEIVVCPAVMGEILAGFKCGAREQMNRDEFDQFLDTPRVTPVHADETTAEFYAEIFRALRDKGTPVPTNDMWIAATAMQHGAAVCTRDTHFDGIDGLVVVRP